MYVQHSPSHAFAGFAQPGVPNQRAAGVFFSEREDVPGFFIMTTLEILQIIRTSVYIALGTWRERSAPQNHELWRD